jgi:hypothetical protein
MFWNRYEGVDFLYLKNCQLSDTPHSIIKSFRIKNVGRIKKSNKVYYGPIHTFNKNTEPKSSKSNVQYTWSDNKTVICPYVDCNSGLTVKKVERTFEDQLCRIQIKLCAFPQTLHPIPSKCKKKYAEIHGNSYIFPVCLLFMYHCE